MSDWDKLSEAKREEMVRFLREELPESFFVAMREAHRKDPSEWWAKNAWHFNQGMQVRNLLREIVRDEELPSGNLDEVYVEAIETAAGVRSG